MEQPGEKREALRAIVEHIVPGRWRDVRAPTEKELKATAVLAMPIEEASAKVRSGQPLDDEEDYALGGVGGRHPALDRSRAPPQPDPRLRAGIALPAYASAYARPGSPRPRR